MPVVFDVENHIYTNPETSEAYISATTLLGQFKPKFDVDKQAAIFAKREGLSVEDVKSYWNDLNKISTTKGTLIHAALENFLKDGTKSEDHKILINYIREQLKNNHSYNLISEDMMYNDEYKLAGTADIVLEDDKFFKIWDLKTNKRIRFTNTFRTDTFLLKPVDHIVNCEYSNYALQLSLYAYMKEQLTGKKCIELKIIYLNPGKFNQSERVDDFYVSYLKSDILKILEHRKMNF